MDLKDLTPEQKAKAEACTSPKELLAFAEAEGIELSDEQLEKVSGGWSSSNSACPDCGSTKVAYDSFLGTFICQNCGCEF